MAARRSDRSDRERSTRRSGRSSSRDSGRHSSRESSRRSSRDSGRYSTRDSRRSSRRDRDDDDDRDSRRGSSRGGTSEQTYYIAGGVGAAVLLIVGVIAVSGGGKSHRSRGRPRPPAPPAVRPVRRSIDWYTKGKSDGGAWARKVRARHAGHRIDRAEAENMGDMQTSNSSKQGIRRDGGEKRYIKGFCDAALRGQTPSSSSSSTGGLPRMPSETPKGTDGAVRPMDLP